MARVGKRPEGSATPECVSYGTGVEETDVEDRVDLVLEALRVHGPNLIQDDKPVPFLEAACHAKRIAMATRGHGSHNDGAQIVIFDDAA